MKKTVEDVLAHYGVKGMKWGIRRDRSKASSGKTTYQKKPNKLSEAELKRRIGRMELEKKYSDLNTPQTFSGKKYAQSVLENTGRQATGIVVGTAVSYFVQRAIKSKFG